MISESMNMKTIQFIIRTLMVLMLAVVTEYASAASLTHELGTDVTVAWYSNQEKENPITIVTLTDSEQTIYVNIAPAEGYWTDKDHLNGVEKIASLIHAGAPMKRSPSYSGLGTIAEVEGENYAANGAGLYQVTVPALADGQTDDQIAEICLIGTIVESTDLYGATITASSATYTGDVQTASGITVTLGETELTLGTHYTVTTNAGGTDVGNYAVEITGMGHYKGTATNDDAFEITKAALTVTANANTITYGDAPANDGVTYSGFVGTEDESVLTGTLGYTYSYTQYGDVGNYTITPSGLTSSNYDITFATGTLTVEQREVTLSWSDTELTYNRSAQKPTATAGNLVNSDECTVTVSGEQTNVGTGYTATASALSYTNYKLPSSVTQTFSISAKTLTITADAKSKTYGEDDPTLTYTSSGLVDGDNITGSLSRASGENVGTYAINQGTLTAGNNYSISYTGANLTINKAALTVTAKAQTITYGGSIATGIGQVTTEGLVTGDALTTVTLTPSTANATTSGTITPSAAGTTKGITNYSVTYNTGLLTINKASINPTVSMNGWTYGGVATNPSVTGNTGNGTVTYRYKVSTAADNTYSSTKPNAANTYTVEATIAATSNYNSGTATKNFTISKAALTVTAKPKTINYGDEPANDGVTYSGFVNNETEAVLGGTLAFDYNYSQNDNVGTYTITPSGLTSDNYNISFVAGTLTVNSKVIEDTDGTEVTEDEHGYTVNVTETTSNTAADIIDLPDNETVYNLTYSRTLSSPTGDGDTKINDVATNLYTTCLPFAPTPTNYLKFYELTGVSGSTLLFGEVETPAANTPYMVAVSGDNNITIAPDAISDLSLRQVIEGNPVVGGYTMMGTHTGLSNSDARSVVGERDCFILQINNKWGKVVEGSVYIPPFRAFIKGPAVVNGAPLTGSFDSEATGIDSLRLVNHDGTDQWYDLNGRLIERPVKKGLYIHKGNKISIK